MKRVLEGFDGGSVILRLFDSLGPSGSLDER